MPYSNTEKNVKIFHNAWLSRDSCHGSLSKGAFTHFFLSDGETKLRRIKPSSSSENVQDDIPFGEILDNDH